MDTFEFFSAALLLILTARLILARLKGEIREVGLALVNLPALYLFCYSTTASRIFAPLIYALIVCMQYMSIQAFSEKKGWKSMLAFFTPILILIIVIYTPYSYYLSLGKILHFHVDRKFYPTAAHLFVGISYLAFRSSYLAIEIRNGTAKRPRFWEYVNFCLFVPTLTVGPISPYSVYRTAFSATPPKIPIGSAAMRILVGMLKYKYFGSLLNQLCYNSWLRDDHGHYWMDLGVAATCYYLYLYCNFSGFCDIGIGVAGLIGIPVAENFNNPFAARNVKDFWNRWHITLSVYMRDVVFSPLSKYLGRMFGPENINHAIALTIFAVFLLVGIWHGVGWNYAAFGFAHGIGVVANHYYTIYLKKRLGRDGFKAYNANPWIHAVAVVATFCYVSATLFLFANTFPQIKDIFDSMR